MLNSEFPSIRDSDSTGPPLAVESTQLAVEAPLPSIRDHEPAEQGGTTARQGFRYQDHVAAHFLIRMLNDVSLVEVWVELQDDITLVYSDGDATSSISKVEFVQVKSDDLDQLWSPALITKREKSGIGTSIAEKLHAYDRFREPCSFRLVTRHPAGHDLAILHEPVETRSTDFPGRWAALCGDMQERLPGWLSHKGMSIVDWLERTRWDSMGHPDALAKGNRLDLLTYLSSRAFHLAPDQVDTVYESLVALAADAAAAPWRRTGTRKILGRLPLIEVMDAKVRKVVAPHEDLSSPVLRQKMVTDADLPEPEYHDALYFRALFRQHQLDPKYQAMRNRSDVNGTVRSELHALRSRLNAGDLEDNGRAFHAQCVQALQSLARVDAEASYADYLGCMYDVADRCIHRFRRAS